MSPINHQTFLCVFSAPSHAYIGICYGYFNGIKHFIVYQSTRLLVRTMTLSLFRLYSAKARWVISTALASTQFKSDIHPSLFFNTISRSSCTLLRSSISFDDIMTTRFLLVFSQFSYNSAFWRFFLWWHRPRPTIYLALLNIFLACAHRISLLNVAFSLRFRFLWYRPTIGTINRSASYKLHEQSFQQVLQ